MARVDAHRMRFGASSGKVFSSLKFSRAVLQIIIPVCATIDFVEVQKRPK
jgi:hypothetical protein